MTEIDNSYKLDGVPLRRFYLNRIKDETGISRTGRVLEGVLTQSGRVIVEWRPPHSTMGIYSSMEEFRTIHVDCHPSMNEVVWLDGLRGDVVEGPHFCCPYCNCQDFVVVREEPPSQWLRCAVCKDRVVTVLRIVGRDVR